MTSGRIAPSGAACVLVALLGTAGAQEAAQPEPAAPTAPQRVEVIGTAPLPGQGVERDLLPYSTQLLRRDDIDRAQATNLTDTMARRLPGVQVNDIQGSPFQGDLTFRGYRASGLLGASQGLSVYLDGVRINEPFGDVVNWDLVPEFALESVALVPGANPAFGLNTLGGAIALTTESGLSAPGAHGEIGYGSFGRKTAEARYGHADEDGWHQYVGASWFEENGWRDHSPGRISQALAKIGHDGDDLSWTVGVLAGRSTLVGNGLLPAETLEPDGAGGATRVPDLYANDRSAVYTYPDETRNRLGQLTLDVRRHVDADSELSLLAYVRSSRRDTVNGDEADDDDDDDDEGSAERLPLRRLATADDDAEPNAVFNTTKTRQTAYGIAAAFSRHAGAHQWQAGASADGSRVKFRQSEQAGFFNDARGVVPGNVPAVESVAVEGRSRIFGVYASDTWALAEGTHLTGTLRFNHARVENTLSTLPEDDDAGDGLVTAPQESFTYRSANPAIGVAQAVGAGITLFGNVARNTRVPTVIELGCADPEAPCRLPAGLQSDPHLKQVRSSSFEVGGRWRDGAAQSASVSIYRTDNRDDILFRSVGITSQLGFFQNFDKTRNQGVDAQWQGRLGGWTLQLAYSFLEATYEASDVLRVGDRNLPVHPGTRIAGMPRHTLKAGADYAMTPEVSVGADWQLLSARTTQGNEDGAIDDDGTRADLGLAGYGTLNLRGSWKPMTGIELTLRVDNVFDRRYASYGAIGGTVFDARGAYTGIEREAFFVAPGTPRGVFAGIRASF